jgi:hypothetical protein
LADALEVSVRTVYRDVEALSESGVPDPHGAGRERRDRARRRLPPGLAQFTNDEFQALFTAAAGPMTDLGFISPTRALCRNWPARCPLRSVALPRRIATVLLARSQQLGPRRTADRGAATAARSDRRADGRAPEYRDRGGALTSRLVDPLGLVAKAGVWYVVANEPGRAFGRFARSAS